MVAKAKKRPSRALGLMSAINASMEKDVVRLGSDEYFRVTRVPTGSLTIDRITGGGFAHGRHVEIYGDECVVPETKVLNADLEWVDAGSLKKGTEIVGFDEVAPSGRGKQRCLRRAIVKSNKLIQMPCYEISTDRGTKTVASENHKWLVIDRNKNTCWRESSELQVGDKIQWFGESWERPEGDDALAAAYLAGLFDGEGYSDRSNRVAFAQVEGDVLEYGESLLQELGFTTIVRLANANRNPDWKPVYQVIVSGGAYEVMKFFGMVQPVRLRPAWEGASISKRGPYIGTGAGIASVTKIRFCGMREVCGISTSTQTLITDGLFSHNSGGKSYILYRTLAFSQQRGNVAALVDPEHTFDPDWFTHLGGNPDELVLQHPENAEDAVGVMMLLAQYAEDESLEVVGMDSIASLVTTEEMAKDPREVDRLGSQARMMSRALRRITTVNKKTLFIWTNQERMNIGVSFGSPRTTPGGRAMRFYATTRIEMRRAERVKAKKKIAIKEKLGEREIPVGHWVQVKAEKEKSTRPYGQGMFVFDTERGEIDLASEIIQLGLEDDIITRRDNTFTYSGVEGTYSGTRARFRKEILNDDALRQELIDSIQDATIQKAKF